MPRRKRESKRKAAQSAKPGGIRIPPPERRIHPAGRRAALGLPDESGVPIGIGGPDFLSFLAATWTLAGL
jgi:hypothetical protein